HPDDLPARQPDRARDLLVVRRLAGAAPRRLAGERRALRHDLLERPAAAADVVGDRAEPLPQLLAGEGLEPLPDGADPRDIAGEVVEPGDARSVPARRRGQVGLALVDLRAEARAGLAGRRLAR